MRPPWQGSLTRRLVWLSLLQALAVIAVALIIAWLTLPNFPGGPDGPGGPGGVGGPGGPGGVGGPGGPRPLGHHPALGPISTLIASALIILAGGYLTAQWLIRPLQALERASRALGEGDFSARTGLERPDELGGLAQTFDGMASQIERMLKAERTLLAAISHELRTPLARVRVAMELVEEGEPVMAQAALEDISQDLAEMEILIDDILASARLEQASSTSHEVMSGHREQIAPATLVSEAVRRVASRYPRRSVEVSASSDLPLVSVHRVLWRRALENLLENAHKYTALPTAEVQVSAHQTPEGRVAFEVRNLGGGLSAEDEQRLFEPFYRGTDPEKKRRSGLGLGLSLVQRIVHAHGGHVTLARVADETVVTLVV